MFSVELDHIYKTYQNGKVTAVDDISFSVERGELFGLIGPDGAGKTSLFRILTTLLLADKGTATVDGFDVVKSYKEIRKIVGYMPGKFSLYQDLTVKENLNFFATLFGTTIKKNYDLIKDIYVQIEPFGDRMAGKLSGGMKQKLALCCALIHKPSVLFLDEPTTGVDAVSRKEFWEMLGRLKKEGITILVSTPYMDEATLCDRIALIQAGKILSINTPEKIIESYPGNLYGIYGGSNYALLKELRLYPSDTHCNSFGDSVHITLENNEEVEHIRSYLAEKGHPVLEIKNIKAGIEDCFIRLVSAS